MKKTSIFIVLFFTLFCLKGQSFLWSENTKDFESKFSRLGSEKLINQVISIDFSFYYTNNNKGLRGFYNVIPDTVWIRKKKKPQEGKDYTLNNIYKKTGWRETDLQSIVGHRFLIEKVVKLPNKQLSSIYDYYLKDIVSGDQLIWRVPEYYNDYDDGSEPRSIFLPEISKIFKNELIGKYFYIPYFKENAYGLKYKKVKCIDCDFFYSKSFSYSYLSLLLELEDDELLIRYKTSTDQYSFIIKDGNEEDITGTYWGKLITVEEYNKLRDDIIKEKKEKVTYNISLEKTEKNKRVYKTNDNAFVDENIDITWKFTKNKNYFGFVVENKTSSTIKIQWENGSFVNPNKIACGLVHKDAVDNKKSQSPTIVPSHSKVIDVVVPTEEFYSILNNDNVKIILPFEINNKTVDYIFTFRYTLDRVYPLLQVFNPDDFNLEKEAEEFFQKATK